ncbi:iron-containing redox enzyme family protein [Fluoribacter dumoffii]|uniref:iron-containing redox enzyme family protein n=1 Tax=Fluoribacter dumoffii TaxID=463 RepID=UPI00224400D8|nr:iron-containing redox enzyme family protein [Fluoribacter dumoffii]MCW8418307.1 iron-containing redox enzyme family protein [Fluoribacter dumoffii]MCW8453851.1 iron-containing redox enzyme family protein [Fluoribacter dumoffii]MCW8462078.1 iron-containing redox enzyme family protein [Fluoribacter dumoffii]MCW8482290.1 iron-containing redox enzyme family protein [Fluoribacter dumoffii]
MSNCFEVSQSLHYFLHKADSDYRHSISSIPLFNSQKTWSWNSEQKKVFAAIFYHLRGHFIDFAWYIANFTCNHSTKKIILDNIYEELGIGTRFSHEMLFERFAKECGVNIHDEIVNETNYLPFARKFNKGHLRWLSEHDEEERIAAFAAYERLDNLDYSYLVQMAQSINLSQHACTFFKVHAHVTHFDSALELILPIWETNPEKIIQSFHFIYTHQNQMWRDLSAHVFALPA